MKANNFLLKTRINRNAGMNIARALGDKFLKEEESAFSAEPFISNVFRLSGDGLGLVVMARYVHTFFILCSGQLNVASVFVDYSHCSSVRH